MEKSPLPRSCLCGLVVIWTGLALYISGMSTSHWLDIVGIVYHNEGEDPYLYWRFYGMFQRCFQGKGIYDCNPIEIDEPYMPSVYRDSQVMLISSCLLSTLSALLSVLHCATFCCTCRSKKMLLWSITVPCMVTAVAALVISAVATLRWYFDFYLDVYPHSDSVNFSVGYSLYLTVLGDVILCGGIFFNEYILMMHGRRTTITPTEIDP